MTDGLIKLEELKRSLLETQSSFAAKAMQGAIDYITSATVDVEGREVDLALYYLATVVGQFQSKCLEIASHAEGQLAVIQSKEKA